MRDMAMSRGSVVVVLRLVGSMPFRSRARVSRERMGVDMFDMYILVFRFGEAGVSGYSERPD